MVLEIEGRFYTIPTEPLTFNKIDKGIKIIANKIFKWNYKVVR